MGKSYRTEPLQDGEKASLGGGKSKLSESGAFRLKCDALAIKETDEGVPYVEFSSSVQTDGADKGKRPYHSIFFTGVYENEGKKSSKAIQLARLALAMGYEADKANKIPGMEIDEAKLQKLFVGKEYGGECTEKPGSEGGFFHFVSKVYTVEEVARREKDGQARRPAEAPAAKGARGARAADEGPKAGDEDLPF